MGDPVECAAMYDRQGADEIVFLDITATHEKRKTIIDVVSRTAKKFLFLLLSAEEFVRLMISARFFVPVLIRYLLIPRQLIALN